MNRCPICGKSSQFNSSRRKDEICPICGSSERHRFLWVFLKDNPRYWAVKKMLHIAPEECLEKKFREQLQGYVSMDKFSNRAMVNMDITDIRFGSLTFDFLYCSHVLEHVVDDILAIKEMFRVLKHGAFAIINVPIPMKKTYEDNNILSKEDRLKHFGQPDHVRIYGKDYIERLRSVGFKVKEVKPKDFLTKEEIRLMGITPLAGSIFLCEKSK